MIVTRIISINQIVNAIIQNNRSARRWMGKRRFYLAAMTSISGGLYPSLRLASSHMFGLEENDPSNKLMLLISMM